MRPARDSVTVGVVLELFGPDAVILSTSDGTFARIVCRASK